MNFCDIGMKFRLRPHYKYYTLLGQHLIELNYMCLDGRIELLNYMCYV